MHAREIATNNSQKRDRCGIARLYRGTRLCDEYYGFTVPESDNALTDDIRFVFKPYVVYADMIGVDADRVLTYSAELLLHEMDRLRCWIKVDHGTLPLNHLLNVPGAKNQDFSGHTSQEAEASDRETFDLLGLAIRYSIFH